MSLVLSLFIQGTPQPGGSKRAGITKAGRAFVFDDAKYGKEWRLRVSAKAEKEWQGQPLLDEPLDVRMVFYVLRPKCHYGTGKNATKLKASAPAYPTTKPDALKLARSTEDALTGIIWRDDCTTVDLAIAKRFGTRPGVLLWVATKRPEATEG